MTITNCDGVVPRKVRLKKFEARALAAINEAKDFITEQCNAADQKFITLIDCTLHIEYMDFIYRIVQIDVEKIHSHCGKEFSINADLENIEICALADFIDEALNHSPGEEK